MKYWNITIKKLKNTGIYKIWEYEYTEKSTYENMEIEKHENMKLLKY